jgi:hypothetical protein
MLAQSIAETEIAEEPTVNQCPIDPTAPTLYAGTSDGGSFKSTDGAVTWTAINLGLLNFELNPIIQVLAIDPSRPGLPRSKVYAGTNGSRLLDRTGTHNGAVFQHFINSTGFDQWGLVGDDRNGLTTPDVQALVVDTTTTPGTLYAGTNGNG